MVRGRPRSFDQEEALQTALELFWRYGYEGTSLSALTDAMGISVPSLYAAFGNKESLFRAAVDRYIEGPASYVSLALREPTVRRVAEKLLAGAIDMVMTPANPNGCLLVQGALACAETNEAIRKELSLRRKGAEAAVRQRFAAAIKAGDLPPDTDVEQLARYFMTTIWGMSVQAAGGATRRQLQQIAKLTLQVLPEGT